MTTKKGKKRVKNEPVHYEELKEKHTIHITPSTWGKVKEFAKKEGVSVSVYIEELIRIKDAFKRLLAENRLSSDRRFSAYVPHNFGITPQISNG